MSDASEKAILSQIKNMLEREPFELTKMLDANNKIVELEVSAKTHCELPEPEIVQDSVTVIAKLKSGPKIESVSEKSINLEETIQELERQKIQIKELSERLKTLEDLKKNMLQSLKVEIELWIDQELPKVINRKTESFLKKSKGEKDV